MKRYSILLSLLIFSSFVIPSVGQEFYLGVTGGMNIAEMMIVGDGEDQVVDPVNLIGFGGIIGFQFGNHLSLQIRPLYLQKGGKLIQDLPAPDADLRMSFLELDFSLKATAGNQFRPYILAGPSIGLLMTSEAEFENSGYIIKADVKDISKKIECGLGIGAGVEFSLWKGFIFLEGRYTFGLNNLNKGGTLEFKLNNIVVDTEKIDKEDIYKNRGFQIMAGYTIPLGKK